jgi:protein gp37
VPGSGCPIFFKQWGEYLKVYITDHQWRWEDEAGKSYTIYNEGEKIAGDENNFYYKIGKKLAGRVIDGRTWDKFPK